MTVRAARMRADRHRWAHLLEAGADRGVGADLPVRSWIFDVLLALVFTGVGSAFLPVFYPDADAVDFAFVVAINLPLILRRRWPRIAFGLVALAGLTQIFLPRPIGIHDAGLLFSLYSLVGYSNRRVGLFGLGVTVVITVCGSLTDWWGYIDDQLTHDRPTLIVHVLTLLGVLLLVLASWASGERLRSARVGMTALAERAATLEREREQQARLAAAAERARIAREMHDVIAHALSVMIAQADGAGYVIDESPAQARTALDRIARTGRDSLTEMRGLLGLLREGDSPRELAPHPGLEQLSDLIEEATESGLHVEVRQSDAREAGPHGPVAQMVALTTYRVVQEGLSNARKHGGEDVSIDLEYRADGITVMVENVHPSQEKAAQAGPSGHGLIGMSERVAAVGGRLETGVSDDGFRISAWLPYSGRPVG